MFVKDASKLSYFLLEFVIFTYKLIYKYLYAEKKLKIQTRISFCKCL